jgi:hypothetical protein
MNSYSSRSYLHLPNKKLDGKRLRAKRNRRILMYGVREYFFHDRMINTSDEHRVLSTLKEFCNSLPIFLYRYAR